MKDEYSLKQGERFDYSTIDVEYLRTLQQLPDWLRENKRSRAEVRYNQYLGFDDITPPGHPKVLVYKPYHWMGPVENCIVIPDPENYAYLSPSYSREHQYRMDTWDREGKMPGAENNKYYIIYQYNYRYLWKPLPWDHVRMRVWEIKLYRQYNGYLGENNELFWPSMDNFNMIGRSIHEPKIDEHWTEEYKAQKWHEYHAKKEAYLAERAAYNATWATPDRYQAVVEIRKRYKDYKPRLDLIANVKSDPLYALVGDGQWYYRYASPEDKENDPL